MVFGYGRRRRRRWCLPHVFDCRVHRSGRRHIVYPSRPRRIPGTFALEPVCNCTDASGKSYSDSKTLKKNTAWTQELNKNKEDARVCGVVTGLTNAALAKTKTCGEHRACVMHHCTIYGCVVARFGDSTTPAKTNSTSSFFAFDFVFFFASKNRNSCVTPAVPLCTRRKGERKHGKRKRKKTSPALASFLLGTSPLSSAQKKHAIHPSGIDARYGSDAPSFF